MESVKQKFERLLSHSVVISDGGMGTLLQAKGLNVGHPPEEINLSNPEWVSEIHKSYIKAGAQIVTTNTFGGNRYKLSQFGLRNNLLEINQKAAQLARHVCMEKTFIAGSVGPTGELLFPMGSVTMDELIEAFSEQVRALQSGGVDFVILETMSDVGELIAAARACALNNMPFIASMTFDTNGRSLSGTTPEVCSTIMEAYNPLAIGSNCGMGPAEMVRIVPRFTQSTHIDVIMQPNAGLPRYVQGETFFEMSPDDFAGAGKELVMKGASIVGGCCGTTPDHIHRLKCAVEDTVKTTRYPVQGFRCASRTQIVTYSGIHPFGIIGERINPTGRKKLSSQLLEHDFSLVKREARRQIEAGAQMLDINVGVPGANEVELMEKVVNEVQSIPPHVPLAIDSNDPLTLEKGLNAFIGRGLMNSITGDPAKLERLIPVVRNLGCNFIALAMDEKGIPKNSSERMDIIKRIVTFAENEGIDRRRILVDCLVFTIGSQPKQALETIKAIRKVREELGCFTVLGVSNVSFGLPGRAVLSSTFLAMAIEAGLNAGIINPISVRMMETVRAADLLMNKDPGAKVYIDFVEKMDKATSENRIKYKEKKKTGHSLDAFKSKGEVDKIIIEGDKDAIVQALKNRLNSGRSPEKILKEEMIPAINLVGDMYGAGRIFLPQLILAGETMRLGMRYLTPFLKKSKGGALHSTPVVIGTVEGDIHDIGKNIVSIVLENLGFRVIDLGKNVSAETFISEAQEHNAKLAALSALMTTTLPVMKETVHALKRAIPEIKIMVGGAVVTQSFALEIQADGYAKEASSAGDLAQNLIAVRSRKTG